MCLFVFVNEKERVCITPFQFLNQFADFHETCYECYVIRTHSTLHSDCMQSIMYRRANVKTHEAEVTLTPPTLASGNDGNIYWENMGLLLSFFLFVLFFKDLR